jgi:hypothetical protein
MTRLADVLWLFARARTRRATREGSVTLCLTALSEVGIASAYTSPHQLAPATSVALAAPLVSRVVDARRLPESHEGDGACRAPFRKPAAFRLPPFSPRALYFRERHFLKKQLSPSRLIHPRSQSCVRDYAPERDGLGVRETDAMIVAQQFIAGDRQVGSESVKRTTEVLALERGLAPKTSAVRFTDLRDRPFFPALKCRAIVTGSVSRTPLEYL